MKESINASAYSPALRRWMVPDPLGEKYYGVNPYAYCSGDPVNYVDPEGQKVSAVFNRYTHTLYITDLDHYKKAYQKNTFLRGNINWGEFVTKRDV